MIDRIEFYNPGKLYGGITIDDLLTGNYTSKSRNKLIAKIFKEAGLIERYGSGIMRVRQICKDYGLIEPYFSEISNGFMVTLFKEKHHSKIVYTVNEYLGTDKAYVYTDSDTNSKVVDTDNIPVNVPVNVPVNILSRLEINILDEIKQDNSVVLSDIAVKLAVNIKTVKRYVQKLKQKGLLQRIGPDNGGYWVITETKT